MGTDVESIDFLRISTIKRILGVGKISAKVVSSLSANLMVFSKNNVVLVNVHS